jgi:hypothetical protein
MYRSDQTRSGKESNRKPLKPGVGDETRLPRGGLETMLSGIMNGWGCRPAIKPAPTLKKIKTAARLKSYESEKLGCKRI